MGGIAMRLPHLNLPNLTRIPLHLGGLAPVHRAAEGNLSYMENLITEQGVTATRAPRAILASPRCYRYEMGSVWQELFADIKPRS